MARYSGKNLVVKNGANVIGGVRSFSVEETIDTVDLTAGGDAAQSHDTGIPGWSASISALRDDAADQNQALRAGDSITFAGYGEGDGSGKKYLAGTATVTSISNSVSYDGEATVEYQCQGNGALAVETVTP